MVSGSRKLAICRTFEIKAHRLSCPSSSWGSGIEHASPTRMWNNEKITVCVASAISLTHAFTP